MTVQSETFAKTDTEPGSDPDEGFPTPIPEPGHDMLPDQELYGPSQEALLARRVSMTSSPVTLAALLTAAEPILGRNRAWNPSGESPEKDALQAAAAGTYAEFRGIATELREVESIAAADADAINAFLASKGLSAKLGPFGPDSFGVAAVSEFAVEWINEGTRDMIWSNLANEVYPAFTLGCDWITCDSESPDETSTFWIQTQNGDLVGVAMAERPESSETLLAEVRRRMAGSNAAVGSPRGVQLPCVDIDLKPDVSHMVGMWTIQEGTGKTAKIVQAVMQALFAMNRRGARSKVGMAAEVVLESCVIDADAPPPPVVFDRPFILWMQRPGVDAPLCAYYVGLNDWKEPPEDAV